MSLFLLTVALAMLGNLATSTVRVSWEWWPAAVWTGVVALIAISVLGEIRRHAGHDVDMAGSVHPRSAVTIAGQPAGAAVIDEVMRAARDSYLRWIITSTERIPVRGLVRGEEAITLPLDHIYVALKVDPSTQTERLAASENLRRELDAYLDELDLAPADEEQQRWYLLADLPVADYFSAPRRSIDDAAPGWSIDEFYRLHATGVLLGDPGSGKTTIMRWLALIHARACLAGKVDVRVPRRQVDVAAAVDADDVLIGTTLLPVLVRVAEYATDRQARLARGEQPRPLLAFIGHHSWDHLRPVWHRDVGPYRVNEQIPGDILVRLIGDALRVRQALVVLDGLDEVAAQDRVETAEAVAEFVRSWAAPQGAHARGGLTNRIYATSRIAGYQLAPLPTHVAQVTLEPMTEGALTVFVRHWLGEISAELRSRGQEGGTDPRALADRLIGMLSSPENRHARDLASNPLLAGVVVSIFVNGVGTLPAQRVELYQAAVDSLVEAWSRRLGRLQSVLQFEYATIVDALPAVAVHIHETKPSGVIRRAEFRRELLREVARVHGGRPSPQLEVEVDNLLQTMGVELGLVVESGPEALRFSHLTFQEYLAGRHLAFPLDHAAERIAGKLGDPRWREPILMAIALVNWKTSDLVRLTDDLLAISGPLDELLPESALLLAAAVPQMADVPSDVVRRIVGRLLASYTALTREGRLPKVRELIEAALATLRSDEHRAEVDGFLAATLVRPAGDAPAIAAATAGMVRAVDAASPQLAEALVEGRDRWDGPATGHLMTDVLTRLIAPATVDENHVMSGPRLPAEWGSGRLRLRDALQRNAEIHQRVVRDSRWQMLVLSLYGGQWNLGAAEAFDEYYRIANYLQLNDGLREQFESWFGQRWGRDDPVYNMAVYLDTVGVQLKRRWGVAPQFDANAMSRDSPLTSWVLQALHADDLSRLHDFLRARLSVPDAGARADAMVALWALGDDVAGALADGTAAATQATRRISGLAWELRDAAVRAAPHAAEALSRAATRLPGPDWEHLRSGLTSVLLDAGSAPIGLTDISVVSGGQLVAILAEEFTHRILGWGDDIALAGPAFASFVDDRRFGETTLVAALNVRANARHNRFGLYTSSWPADRLAWPYHGEDDVPTAVLDQILRTPPTMVFAPNWLATRILSPFARRNPDLSPELLAVVWHVARRDQDLMGWINELDPALTAAPDPFAHLLEAARAVGSPWHRARALVRLAEISPNRRTALLAETDASVHLLVDPIQEFQVRERLLLLSGSDEREARLAALRAAIGQIAEPTGQARALLRLARHLPVPTCDEPVVAALALVGGTGSRDDRLGLLRLALDTFADRPAVRDAVHSVIDEAGLTPAEAAAVLDQPAQAISTHLHALIEDPAQAQLWAPVALYARAAQAQRAADEDRRRAAWDSLVAAPTDVHVATVLETYGQVPITCTGPVVRAVTHAATRQPATLEPLLARLAHLDCDGEVGVRGWLCHPHQQLRHAAVLLLGEYQGLTEELARPLTKMLVHDDDLLRARARNLLDSDRDGGSTRSSLARLGRAGVEALARLGVTNEWDEPSAKLVVAWHLGSLMFDDAATVTAWCDQSNRDGDRVCLFILSSIQCATGPVWSALMEQLRRGTPATCAAVLKACARMSQRTKHGLGSLRLDDDRWEQLWHVLRGVDAEPLRGRRALVATVEAVVTAATVSLEATGGVLDADSAGRASAALWASAGTDLGTIVATGDTVAARAALTAYGEAQYAPTQGDERAAAALSEASAVPGRAEWGWVRLLARWADSLLTDSPYDPVDCWERSNVLIVAAVAAESSPDTFRGAVSPDSMSARLAEAAILHNSFPGRRAAARQLGVLRHGSTTVLDALRHCLLDVSQVRSAALDAIPRLRNVDQAVIENLTAALYDNSTLNAWAAAQLLSVIGQKSGIPATVRNSIVEALAVATRDPQSRRTVHFSYVPAPIPGMPELDDVFAEALRQVYGLGSRD